MKRKFLIYYNNLRGLKSRGLYIFKLLDHLKTFFEIRSGERRNTQELSDAARAATFGP